MIPRLTHLGNPWNGVDSRAHLLLLFSLHMNKSLPPLSEESANLLQHLETRFNAIDQRFDGVDKCFDGVDKCFDGVDKCFDGVDKRFNNVDNRFDGIDKRFDVLENRFDTLEDRVTDIGETVEFMKETMVTKDEFTAIATKQELYRSHDALVKRIERHEKLGTHAHR